LTNEVKLIVGINIIKMRRNTQQREAIIRILMNTRGHPTADDIYDKVRKEIPTISKGTVYRNLKILQQTGKVRELNIDGTRSRFEAAIGHHYHFRCDSCGILLDLDVPINTELDREITEKTGLRITRHQLEFCGLCHDCQSGISQQTMSKARRK
jgi:Fur family transcriptional regulator, peroxide stress response regulator